MNKGQRRYGLWIYTKENRGKFYHGDRDEVQAPYWSLKNILAGMNEWGYVEICPRRLLMLLSNWPEAVADAKKTFERHKNDKEGK